MVVAALVVVAGEALASVDEVGTPTPCSPPGGVELVTGANKVSSLDLTSHIPVLLYLAASSAKCM